MMTDEQPEAAGHSLVFRTEYPSGMLTETVCTLDGSVVRVLRGPDPNYEFPPDDEPLWMDSDWGDDE